MSVRRHPTCHIIAGPNGAGKSTFAMEYLLRIHEDLEANGTGNPAGAARRGSQGRRQTPADGGAHGGLAEREGRPDHPGTPEESPPESTTCRGILTALEVEPSGAPTPSRGDRKQSVTSIPCGRPTPVAPHVRDGWHCCCQRALPPAMSTSSTRRFLALPSSVVLVATGAAKETPTGNKRCRDTPLAARSSTTLSARCCESVRL